MLASGSWDKTVKLWEVFESRGAKETLVQLAEGESVGLCRHARSLPEVYSPSTILFPALVFPGVYFAAVEFKCLNQSDLQPFHDELIMCKISVL